MIVYKYELPLGDLDENNQIVVRMPAGAQLLDVQVQNGSPVIWALVDTSRRLEPRTFEIVGTGHTLSTPPYRHIATFQMHGGALVFHAFEVL